MEALAGFLILILMATFAIGFIGLFIRIPQIGLRSRGTAAWTMVGSILILIALALSMQAKTTPASPERPTQKAEAQPKSPPPPEDKKAALQAQSDQLWDKIETALQPCDVYVQTAGQAVSGVGRGTTSMADAYEAATTAKRACDMVRTDMYGLKPPAASRGEVKDAFDTAITTCRETTIYKSSTMEAMAKFLDGDQRPSVQVEIKQGMDESQRQAMRCVIDYMAATEKGGVTMKAIKDAEARVKADKSRPQKAN